MLANLGFGCPIHHAWVGDGPRQWATIPDPARPGDPIWITPEDRTRPDRSGYRPNGSVRRPGCRAGRTASTAGPAA